MIPYDHMHNEAQVIAAMDRKVLPMQPIMNSSDKELLWKICTACWKFEPQLRMSAAQIIEHLSRKVGDAIDAVLANLDSWDVTRFIRKSETQLGFGSYGSVYQGDLTDENGATKVAIKFVQVKGLDRDVANRKVNILSS